MNPALLSLITMTLTIPLLLVNIVFPSVNLHFSVNREAILKQSTQQVLDQNRLTQDDISKKLANILVNGLEIGKINVTDRDNYRSVEIYFRHKNLFLNKYFNYKDAQQEKVISLFTDKVVL